MTETKERKAFDKFGELEDKTMLDIFPGIGTKTSSNPHDAPCPPQTATDITQDHALNEWVLNHLALSEEQKKWLITALLIDQKKEAKKTRTPYVKLRSSRLKTPDEHGQRTGVKAMTKATTT